MQWIEEVTRDAAGYVELVTRDLSGKSAHLPPQQLPHRLLEGGECKFRLLLSSQAHTVTPVDDYLMARGWSFCGQAQRLHRFSVDGDVLWVPSQLMFGFLYCATLPLLKQVFTTRSLYGLAFNSGEKSGRLQPGLANSNKAWSNSQRRKDHYFWLLNSRSAARSWRQVFRNALDGSLDVPLPEGEFDVVVMGKRIGHTIIASDVRLQKVTCSDLVWPDGTPMPAKTFNLHPVDGGDLRRSNRGCINGTLENIEPWALTDEQFDRARKWLAEAGCFPIERCHGRLATRLRRDLDLLRAKQLAPCEWSFLPCTTQELACAQNRLYKLRRRTLWEAFQEVLLGGESSPASAAYQVMPRRRPKPRGSAATTTSLAPGAHSVRASALGAHGRPDSPAA